MEEKEIYKGMSEKDLIEIILNFKNSTKNLLEEVEQLKKDADFWAEQYQSLGKEDFEREKQLEKENEELSKKVLGQKAEIKSSQSKFNSVAERYHLLNRLQARYGDKNKLHLSEIHCLKLIKENEELKSAQNSLAVEKLEEVRDRFYEADFYQKVLLPMIKELKGE